MVECFKIQKGGVGFFFMPHSQTLLINVIKRLFHEKQLNLGVYKICAEGEG